MGMTGFEDIAAKWNSSGKCSVHFRADPSGLLTVDKAEAVVEVTEDYDVRVPVVRNDTGAAGEAATDSGATADTKSTEKEEADIEGKADDLSGAAGTEGSKVDQSSCASTLRFNPVLQL